MTNAQTTKTNRYYRVLMALAVLAMIAAMVLTAGRPAHAGEIVIKVNTTEDRADATVNGVCDADLQAAGDQCTLRAAIQESNATPETEVIGFGIPESMRDPSSGVATISPTFALPAITRPVIIKGYSQQGSSANTLATGDNATIMIELDGSKATGTVDGLRIVNSSGSVIRGLAINRFSGSGILISGDVSSGATMALDNRIEGNFIGTDPSGKQDLGNASSGVGVLSGAFGTTVGGTSPDQRNVISGNARQGVGVDPGSGGNLVQGNYVGTDASGKADLGNTQNGVAVFAPNNTIGGTAAGAGNLISGNGLTGVALFDSKNNEVLGNRIGTTVSGTGPLGNDFEGVFLEHATGTSVGDGTRAGANTVAFNGRDGIGIFGSDATGNGILSNSIFANDGLGIDLIGGLEDSSGNTANDPGDGDAGPNGLQNKPVLSSAKTISGTTTIKGSLSSAPNGTYKLQFFSNSSGNEGKKLIGQKTITIDGSGDRSFTFQPAGKVAAGRTVTATATNGSTLDTSEFSGTRTVTSS